VSELETTFQSALFDALNAPMRPTRVRRQNVGKVVKRDAEGRVFGVFRAGPPKGAADLCGLAAPDGLHIEVEVKVDAPQTKPQKAWASFIETFGGVYVLVRYDHRLSFEDNVVAGVAQVDAALAARRSRA